MVLGRKSVDLDRIQAGVVLKGVRGGETLITAYGMKNVFSIKERRGMILIMASSACLLVHFASSRIIHTAYCKRGNKQDQPSRVRKKENCET